MSFSTSSRRRTAGVCWSQLLMNARISSSVSLAGLVESQSWIHPDSAPMFAGVSMPVSACFPAAGIACRVCIVSVMSSVYAYMAFDSVGL